MVDIKSKHFLTHFPTSSVFRDSIIFSLTVQNRKCFLAIPRPELNMFSAILKVNWVLHIPKLFTRQLSHSGTGCPLYFSQASKIAFLNNRTIVQGVIDIKFIIFCIHVLKYLVSDFPLRLTIIFTSCVQKSTVNIGTLCSL